MKPANTKDLRFAAFIRVSTERQAARGESLEVQKAEIEEAVQSLGGHVVKLYGGQEHATEGFEKKQLDQLLADAERPQRPFDAVIVAHQDRWSRHNEKSEEGLQLFLKRRIRFFICEDEQDLDDETCMLNLRMSAAFGAFHARTQSRKSMKSRIHRAESGDPTCGKLPYGRKYNSERGWYIDEEKQQIILEVAKRYIAGEQLSKLAKEVGMNHANLHKILTRRSGTQWQQRFSSERLNIHKTVTITIPPLLPPELIEAVLARVEKNRTYERGKRANGTPYLLGRVIYCAHCGYSLFGQLNHGKVRYYRHAHTERKRKCTCRKSWVPADVVEKLVIRDLFEALGNPVAIEQAIEKLTPSIERIKESEQRVKTLEKQMAKTKLARDRIVRLVMIDRITDADADKSLKELREREEKLKEELRVLGGYLENIPRKEDFRKAASTFKKKYGKLRYSNPSSAEAKIASIKRELSSCDDDYPTAHMQMSWEQKRKLLETIFDGKLPDGRPCGVYISWDESIPRKGHWTYAIRGRFYDDETGVGDQAAVISALHSPARALPRSHFRARPFRLAALC